MFSAPVSFGKKIHIIDCPIKNNRTGKFEFASFVKFDCADYSDIEEVKKADGHWRFKNPILLKMKNVFETKDVFTPSYSFYAIENTQNEIVGLAQTKDCGGDLVLDFIESSPKQKYKFVGQNMVAALCKIALENNFKRLYVPNPIDSAHDFYTKKCSFKDTKDKSSLALSRFGMRRLLKNFSKMFENLPKNI